VSEPPKRRFWDRFTQALDAGRQAYVADIKEVFGRPALDETFWDDLEATLLEGDVGVAMTQSLVGELREEAIKHHLRTPQQALKHLRQLLVGRLSARSRGLVLRGRPAVILVVGVNGSGKTTTVGKLALLLERQGHKPLLAAADTYRAAAVEQLRSWGARTRTEVIAHRARADPGAVTFDAVEAARARGRDVLLIDTAGRLHTRQDLLEELRKLRRVLQRLDPDSPGEVLAVVDAHVGQNSAEQVKVFSEAVNLTGLALAKLDGSARAGVVLAIEQELGVPVKLIGIGENLEDLDFFDPEQYVAALLPVEEKQ
jgi:fused signal recognition particle receptor